MSKSSSSNEILSFDIIDQLCLYVEMNCIVEGVFRIPGDKNEALSIINSIEPNKPLNLRKIQDPQSVCSALKLYMRQGPSLLGDKAWETFQNLQISIIQQNLISFIDNMPNSHKPLLKRILHMLLLIIQNENITKMTPTNLGIVFAPLLAKPPVEDINAEMKVNHKMASFLKNLLENIDSIYDSLPSKQSKFQIFDNPYTLSKIDLDKLCEGGKKSYYYTGDCIIEAGKNIEHIYMIVTGSINIIHNNEIIYSITKGLLIDNSIFLKFIPTSISLFNYVAATPCEICQIDLAIFRLLLSSNIKLQQTLYWNTAILLSKIQLAITGNSNIAVERKRREVIVNTPPMWPVFRSSANLPASTMAVKVCTNLSEGTSSFKIILVNESDTIEDLKKECISKFMIKDSTSYNLYLISFKDNEPIPSSIPLSNEQLLAITFQHVTDDFLYLFFGLITNNDNPHFSLHDVPKLYTLNNCKIKGTSGIIDITRKYIIHYSKNDDKKVNAIYLIRHIEELSMGKHNDIHFTIKGIKGLHCITSKKDSLSILFNLMQILRNYPAVSIIMNTLTDINGFLNDFELRHKPKPPLLYPEIVKLYIDKIIVYLLENPFWQVGTPEEIKLLRANVLNYILVNLKLDVSEEIKQKDLDLQSQRKLLRLEDLMELLFSDLSKDIQKLIIEKTQEAANVLNCMERYKCHQILQQILDAAQILSNIIQKNDCIATTCYSSLLIITVLKTKVKLCTNIEYVRLYIEPSLLEGSASYFISELESAISFFNSFKCKSLLQTQFLSSARKSFNDSQKLKKRKSKIKISNTQIYFPRAFITTSYSPKSIIEIAVSQGNIVEILASDNNVYNPIGLNRKGWVLACNDGCVGWIPEINCRILADLQVDKVFLSNGFYSLFDFLTANDWFLLNKVTTCLSLNNNDIIVKEGNIFQRLYFIQNGEILIKYENKDIILKDGNTFGCDVMLSGGKSMLTAKVNSQNAQLLQFNSIKLLEIFEKHPKLCARFFRFICSDLLHQINKIIKI